MNTLAGCTPGHEEVPRHGKAQMGGAVRVTPEGRAPQTGQSLSAGTSQAAPVQAGAPHARQGPGWEL